LGAQFKPPVKGTPEGYGPFPDFDIAVQVEKMFLDQREASKASGIPSSDYPSAKDDLELNLIDLIKAQSQSSEPVAPQPVGDMQEEAEEAAIAAYKELMAAKEKEVAALTKMIEEKLTRIAELGVEIATMKNDLGDTAEGIIEDKKFLADLEKNCATKEQEWAEICKQRQLELCGQNQS